METASSKISSKIITSGMQNKKLDFKSLCSSDDGVKFALYNKDNKLLFSDSKDNLPINFSKKNYIKDNYIIVVDKSALGHMGVYDVVMLNNTFKSKINKIFLTIIISFIIFYIALCMVGYYLIQLFMKPIKMKEKG